MRFHAGEVARVALPGALAYMTKSSGAHEEASDAALRALVLSAERALPASTGDPARDAPWLSQAHLLAPATLWSEATSALSAPTLSDVVRATVDNIGPNRLLSTGGTSVRSTTLSLWNTRGLEAHASATTALFVLSVSDSVTGGRSSAGARVTDWTKLNYAQVAARAEERCRASASPRTIEPGRYTTVLQPDAVEGLLFMVTSAMDRERATSSTVFADPARPGQTRLGQQVIDRRLTLESDPGDIAWPYMPFDADGFAHRKTMWITNGVLSALPYGRTYADVLVAAREVATPDPSPNPMVFHLHGGPTAAEVSVDDLVAATGRGILVTNFDRLDPLSGGNDPDFAVQGSSRHGTWFIEHGKVKYPVKGLRFVERPMHVLNRVVAVGRSERGRGWRFADDDYFEGGAFSVEGKIRSRDIPTLAPVWGTSDMRVPSLQVRDFNFVGLADAV